MKISILYASQTGNTEKAAGFIREGILSAGDIDVRLINLLGSQSPEPVLAAADSSFMKESAAVIIGTPTYSASMAWQIKKWFDTDKSVRLAGKLGAAFATANFIHGGADSAISDILRHMLVKGMVVYSSGGGFGLPIIHLGPVAIESELDSFQELFTIFGKRVADKAIELFKE
jgi:NAD(P)H dehydrogenase (quinone)